MNFLLESSKRWARWVRSDRNPLGIFFSGLVLGAGSLGVHFHFSWDGPELLMLGVFCLTSAWLGFERAGFIALLRDKDEPAHAGQGSKAGSP